MLLALRPSVFFVQESKYKSEGKFKLDGYIIFELVRESIVGGGLALGCVQELHPVLVRKGNDDVEALSVEISVRNMSIRCCVAYGCQESALIDKKEAFWNFIDEEATAAWNSGSGFILQFDGHLWAGNELIPGDPKKQNRNGKLFQEFLTMQPHLSVVNGLSLCEGVITRTRNKDGKKEESVLDFFVVCSRMLPYVTKMVIDENKKYILTNYKRYRDKAVDSDHFTQYMDVDLQLRTEKPIRREIFNYKDKSSQETFKDITSNTTEFSECFNDNQPLLKQVDKWRNVLKSHCQQAFKKIRISNKKHMKPLTPELSALIDERNELIKNGENENKVKDIENSIADLEDEGKRDVIMKNFKRFSDQPENINLQEVWKILKNICPKNKSNLPTAKKDHKGNLITNPQDIKNLLAKEFKERLRSRPVRPDLGDLEERRDVIFDLHLKLAEETPSSPWKMEDLQKALSDLKTNKSRDHAGYVNELFKNNIIGTDLKLSLLIMCNKLKMQKMIPSFMQYANITTVPKRGSVLVLANQRGIFRVDVIRSILMRLIYNEKYPIIDANMSDWQMGGRKHRGCRNNISIINGIINDVMNSRNKKPILLQISDYEQMFDSIQLKQAISDIYEAGLQDNNLSLVYQANKEIFMAVNTAGGLTERQTITDCILQGDTWGSLLASVQVDSIGQECAQAGYGYLYKDNLQVSLLGLVDDTIGVTEAGYQAQMMNAFLNIKTAEKRLKFGEKKCKSMLVGKQLHTVVDTNLLVDSWKVDHIDNPETGDTDLIETYTGQVEIGKCKEQKYLGFIISTSGNNMVNIQAIKNKSIGTIKKIFTKLDSLHLRKYYFECGLMFMNIMLRPSILYACETYYNIKETEIRQLERIEESFMRKLLKTTKGCPIIQIYIELGQIPARFDIIKIRLSFLKYILDQDNDSLILQFLTLQKEKSIKSDWVNTCFRNLEQLQINLSFVEKKDMSVNKSGGSRLSR